MQAFLKDMKAESVEIVGGNAEPTRRTGRQGS
jgi:hypothetical protein